MQARAEAKAGGGNSRPCVISPVCVQTGFRFRLISPAPYLTLANAMQAIGEISLAVGPDRVQIRWRRTLESGCSLFFLGSFDDPRKLLVISERSEIGILLRVVAEFDIPKKSGPSGRF
jgi:hypothetical protein